MWGLVFINILIKFILNLNFNISKNLILNENIISILLNIILNKNNLFIINCILL